jgi:2-haloacid dehalogenase
VVLFDVNETLLDVQALSPELEAIFGDGVSVGEWFVTVLQHSLVMTLVNDYRELGEIAKAVLEMKAAGRGISIKPEQVEAVLSKLTSLPPHPEVKTGLARLQDAGLRLATLTNSSSRAQEQQVNHAGLTKFFERTFSVDGVKRFKPAPEAYRMAAEGLGVATEEVLMVAAHSWDILGAMKAGCQGALVTRAGKALFPLSPPPTITGPDLDSVSKQIVALARSGA